MALTSAVESSGQASVTLYDLQDPKSPRILCRLEPASQPWFLSSGEVAYIVRQPAGAASQLVRLKLGEGTPELMVAGSLRTYAVAAEGKTLAYEDERGLWLKQGDVLPFQLRPLLRAQGADFSGYAYQAGVRFSSSARYLMDISTNALKLQVFDVRATPPTAWTAPPGTIFNFKAMATWSALGDRLYFRDSTGVFTWDPPAAILPLPQAPPWYDPAPSPDGALIAYAVRVLELAEPHIEVRDLKAGTVTRLLPRFRSHPAFVAPRTLWLQEEEPGFGPAPSRTTGRLFAYDLDRQQEVLLMVRSQLVADVWPR